MSLLSPKSAQNLCFWTLVSSALVRGATAANIPDSKDTTDVDITSTVGRMGSSEVYKDANISVSTLKNKNSYALTITTRSGAANNVGLLNTPWDIRAVTLVAGGKILVDQPTSGDDREEIYVINAQSAQLLDKFACEHPSVSPDKRYLAFIADYPMHASDEDLTSEFAMLYAFDSSLATNHDAPRADFPLMDVPDRRLGIQVFPSRRAPLQQASAEGKKYRTYAILSAFTWSPDSGQFLFADEQSPGVVKPVDKEESTLLLVNVSLKTQNPVVMATIAPDCDKNSGLTCTLEVGQTKFGSAALQMKMTVSGHETRTETLEVPYAAFRSLTVE